MCSVFDTRQYLIWIRNTSDTSHSSWINLMAQQYIADVCIYWSLLSESAECCGGWLYRNWRIKFGTGSITSTCLRLFQDYGLLLRSFNHPISIDLWRASTIHIIKSCSACDEVGRWDTIDVATTNSMPVSTRFDVPLDNSCLFLYHNWIATGINELCQRWTLTVNEVLLIATASDSGIIETLLLTVGVWCCHILTNYILPLSVMIRWRAKHNERWSNLSN